LVNGVRIRTSLYFIVHHSILQADIWLEVSRMTLNANAKATAKAKEKAKAR
jgi:hypothetical protein